MISNTELEDVRLREQLWKWTRHADRSGDELTTQGRLLSFSDDIVSLHQFESHRSEGLVFLRRDDLIGCARGRTEEFREHILRERGTWDVALPALPTICDMAALLAEFGQREEFVTIECEYEEEDDLYETYFVGLVTDVVSSDGDQDAHVRCVDAAGEWWDELSIVPVELISAVTWRDPYVAILSEFVRR